MWSFSISSLKKGIFLSTAITTKTFGKFDITLSNNLKAISAEASTTIQNIAYNADISVTELSDENIRFSIVVKYNNQESSHSFVLPKLIN